MDLREKSASGSRRLISDVPCTDVLTSLDITLVLILNDLYRTRNYKILNERIREKNLFDQLQSYAQYSYIICRPTN
jgi:hypothetical protein